MDFYAQNERHAAFTIEFNRLMTAMGQILDDYEFVHCGGDFPGELLGVRACPLAIVHGLDAEVM